MKHTLAFFFLFYATTCTAQWQFVDGGLGTQGGTSAFGVHDTSLFESAGGVGRYASPQHWVLADSGIDFTQGTVTSFASLGNYFFAGMTIKGGPGTSWRSSDNGAHWVANGGGYVCSNGTYVFCVSNGIYRSEDSGNTNSWVRVTTFQATYLAAIGKCIFATTPTGLWRSIDSGTHWAQDTTPLSTINGFAFIGTLTFGANGPIVKSTDSGSTWNEITIPGRSVSQLLSTKTYLFAGTDSGVYVSLDSGMNWRAVDEGLSARGSGYPIVTALIVFDTQLFVGINAGGGYGYAAARPIREMVDTTKSGVSITPSSDSIEIYPNPAAGIVTILSGGTSILGVSVLNVLGEDLLDMPNLHETDISVDISKLPSGTYFLRIETSSGSVLRKIVKEE